MSQTDTQSIAEAPSSRVGMVAETADAIQAHPPVLSDDAAHPAKVAGSTVHVTKADGKSRTQASYPRLLAAADVFSIAAALIVTIGVLHVVGREVSIFRVGIMAAALIPSWFMVSYVAGLYTSAELRIDHSVVDEFGKLLVAVTAWSWLLMMVRTALSGGPTKMLGPITLWLLVIVFVLAARVVGHKLAEKRGWHTNRVAIVGSPVGVAAVRSRIDRHPEWGLIIEAELDPGRGEYVDFEALADRIDALQTDRVLIVGDADLLAERASLVNRLIERDLKIDFVSGGAELFYSNSVLHHLEGLPVISVRSSQMRPMDRRIKRGFDVVASALGLALVAPILAWAMVRIKIDSPGPAFFRQIRCGLDGEAFEVVKFRTMIDGADSMRGELREASAEERNGDVLFKLEDDPRITPIGRTLRKWSVDELPQLWNVLKGDMSIVGPRPLPFDEAKQATGLYEARTRVKPGLAGAWQAYGRSSIPFADMIRLDYSYAVGWSMAEDLKLLVRTAVAVFTRRGAY